MNKDEINIRKKSPVNIRNKKASFEYFFIEEFTAGIVLTGTEIKSIRLGKASLVDTFCYIENGEVWLKNMYIAEYFFGSYNNHNVRRDRLAVCIIGLMLAKIDAADELAHDDEIDALFDNRFFAFL